MHKGCLRPAQLVVTLGVAYERATQWSLPPNAFIWYSMCQRCTFTISVIFYGLLIFSPFISYLP